ncbi:penicillin-binding protein activator LpoB [Spirochaetia bacterium]|nr:penicillin-binding protein activator LpoB [Spirochaetia bacterium]
MKYFFMCVILVTIFTGCFTTLVSTAPVVSRVDSQTDLSGRWSDPDVEQVCRTLVSDCLGSINVNQAVNQYKSRNYGSKPAVLVGSFSNSSQEHIDTEIISTKMETALLNSGVLDFVSGGAFRAELRSERNDQQYNASEESAARLGKELGATFLLQGSVRTNFDRVGATEARTYYVSAQLTNIETNRILWKGEETIRKQITRPSTRW